jgi:hypothetical protein
MITIDRPNSDYDRRFWRLSFVLLLIAPFLPEITIYFVTALAKLMGCQLDQKNACFIGGVPVSDIIAIALRATAGLLVAAWTKGYVWFIVFCVALTSWIVICLIALTLGWLGTRTRLLLGFAVALVFAVLPYFGPLLAIGSLLNKNCQANEGGVGPCIIFGGSVGSPAHEAVQAGWLILAGAPIALGAFVVYVIIAVVVHAFSRRHPAASAQ